MCYVSLWFGVVCYLSTEEFKQQSGFESSRIGSAYAALDAGISVELWGRHGDWAFINSQKRYAKRDTKSILSVSLDVMNLTSSSSNASLALPYDIREDFGTSSSIDVEDDAITVGEKYQQMLSLVWRTFLEVCSFLYTTPHIRWPSILFHFRGPIMY